METKNLAELYDLDPVAWDTITERLGREITQAPGTGGPDRHTCWLATIDADGRPLQMRSEFLHAFLVTERVRSHLPVLVRHAGSELRAAGMEYDHVARRLDLKGPLRSQSTPRVAK